MTERSNWQNGLDIKPQLWMSCIKIRCLDYDSDEGGPCEDRIKGHITCPSLLSEERKLVNAHLQIQD